MARTLGALLLEADDLINKKVAAYEPRKVVDSYGQPSEKVASLLAQLNAPHAVKEASLQEQLALSIAMVDTLFNMGTFAKIAALEEKCSQAGIPEKEISAFIEKHASQFPMQTVIDFLPWLRQG